MGKKNDEFSFLAKLIPKLVCLGHVGLMVANAVVLDSVFSFKSSNAAITNRGFEFDSRQRHLSLLFLSPSSSSPFYYWNHGQRHTNLGINLISKLIL